MSVFYLVPSSGLVLDIHFLVYCLQQTFKLKSFCESGIWELLRWTIQTQGFLWDWSQDVAEVTLIWRLSKGASKMTYMAAMLGLAIVQTLRFFLCSISGVYSRHDTWLPSVWARQKEGELGGSYNFYACTLEAMQPKFYYFYSLEASLPTWPTWRETRLHSSKRRVSKFFSNEDCHILKPQCI